MVVSHLGPLTCKLCATQEPERLPCLRTRIAIPSFLCSHSSLSNIGTRLRISVGVHIVRAMRTLCLWVIIGVDENEVVRL